MSPENYELSAKTTDHNSWKDFDGKIAENWHAMPGYPSESVQAIVAHCSHLKPAIVVDLGCGTGTFTRQLAAEFDPGCKIIGLDPNADMLKQAASLTEGDLNISYRKSAAETMPFDNGSISVLAAAGAAHRFDSLSFYPEAARVMVESGVLALLHNRPDADRGGFMSEYMEIHEHYVPEYRRDWHSTPCGGYCPLPYERDLSNQDKLEAFSIQRWSWTERVSEATLLAQALSSTVIARAVHRVGQEKVFSEVRNAFIKHADPDGYVNMPYVTEGIFATKK
ncbi:class I SAM-dependent methyltransferase [Mesorhizobium captivum]|uniref:class I SAM-dependent methyltransferase n=1 Tax=Mesorhizobium captivum TaxID=3072319 RepID=UPI002A24A516|nr:class I SAM-dependent methyltransferase [Mesorhizobium sp. VK3C]MDX8450231.1 class I SAM-dependent methyltransferase [Mesorhizobium sp. VK3C]